MSAESLIDEISVRDRVLGWRATEMHTAATHEMWYPALTALFTLAEHVTKSAVGAASRQKFEDVIEGACLANLITIPEKELLDTLRTTRNKYLHAGFHEEAFVIDDLIYPISEPATAEILYNTYTEPTLKIILKLASS